MTMISCDAVPSDILCQATQFVDSKIAGTVHVIELRELTGVDAGKLFSYREGHGPFKKKPAHLRFTFFVLPVM